MQYNAIIILNGQFEILPYLQRIYSFLIIFSQVFCFFIFLLFHCLLLLGLGWEVAGFTAVSHAPCNLISNLQTKGDYKIYVFLSFFRKDKHIRKIPHTGNTRPSRKCVIQDHRFYTMSLSQYHGCCQYHESLSIP